MKVKVVALPVETWDEILRRIEGSDEYAALDFALGKTEEIESPTYEEIEGAYNAMHSADSGSAAPEPFFVSPPLISRLKVDSGTFGVANLNSAMSPTLQPEGFDEAAKELVETLESPVEWIQVESSNLSAVAYQEDLQLLLVEFKKGEVYKYAGVPKGVFESLMLADSKGCFFAANIKDHFPAERLEVKE